MRKRPIKFMLYLNEEEAEKLKQLSEKSGLKRQQCIRNFILQKEIPEKPQKELAEVIRQLSAMGNNINQIARAVNITDIVLVEQLQAIQKQQSEFWEWVKIL